MSIKLVVFKGDELRASSEMIAEGLNQEHRSVLKLLRKHKTRLEEFGQVALEVRAGYQNSVVEFAMLNERQATLLISCMKNTALVMDFKVALVKEFFRMSEAIKNREDNLWAQMQAFIRKEIKSEIKGTVGSLLMHGRRKEKPVLSEERAVLESQIQPKLFH